MDELIVIIKKHRSAVLIAVGIVCAVFLLIASGCEGSGEVDRVNESDDSIGIEKKLTEMIGQLDGVGAVNVFVTMDSTGEAVYAYNKESSESSEKYSYFTDSDKKPILLKEIEPRVRGVAVICDKGDNIIIKRKIIDLVSSVLGIPTNRVFVGS